MLRNTPIWSREFPFDMAHTWQMWPQSKFCKLYSVHLSYFTPNRHNILCLTLIHVRKRSKFYGWYSRHKFCLIATNLILCEVIFKGSDYYCIEQPCRVVCRHSDQNKFKIELHCTTSSLLSSSLFPHLTWFGCMSSCSSLTLNTELWKNCPCLGCSVNFRLRVFLDSTSAEIHLTY